MKLSRNRRPKCIIAHTIKGKGVSFMENELAWHYRSPSDEDVLRARAELEYDS
jgi:transketolase